MVSLCEFSFVSGEPGNYGHYVAKRALQMATPEQSEALIKSIRANLAMLPNRRLWVKWENVPGAFRIICFSIVDRYAYDSYDHICL